MKAVIILVSIIFTEVSFGLPEPVEKNANRVFEASSYEKLTYYKQNYLIFGDNDLKIQFSGKYRVAKNKNIYLGYTQTMFWSIYKKSQPFEDINFSPEVFYRLLERDTALFKSIDFGYSHLSNGKDGELSRSLDMIYLSVNNIKQIRRHSLIGIFRAYKIMNEDDTNKNIQNHLGYWDLQILVTHLITHDLQRVDLEFKLFAGNKVINFNKGGRTIGVIYHSGSLYFNPALYLQYYRGYAENLINYNMSANTIRLGLLLPF